ncbi:MAG TPA: GNAT family N-acetyltransferase [Ohtaekwangia sp.]|nr:GNAT family N-acetyltransferase [Ohtaekwangia sp.]
MISNSITRILLAVPDDLPSIHDVFRDAIENTNAKDYTPEQRAIWLEAANDRERWLRKIEQQYFILARSKARVAGFASLESHTYIDLMYVHPDHAGKGIGTQLISHLEDVARSGGSTILVADVSITAIAFFKKQGFEINHRNVRIIKGVEIINYRMMKHL